MFPDVGDQCEREAIRQALHHGERHPIEDNQPVGVVCPDNIAGIDEANARAAFETLQKISGNGAGLDEVRSASAAAHARVYWSVARRREG